MVSEKASEQMLGHLFACDDKLKVPRLLPPGTRVAHKTGSVNDSRTDAGIIETPSGPIAFCILTNKNKDRRWTDDNEGDLFCAEDRRGDLQVFQSEGRSRSRTGRAQAGNGRRAAIWSRRCSERSMRGSSRRRASAPTATSARRRKAPSRSFKRKTSLEPTGVVDAETWKALGPLVMDEEPAAEPAVVNAEKIKKAPPDALDGPPFVTCKALGDCRRRDRRVPGRRSRGRETRSGQHDQDHDGVSGVARWPRRIPKVLDEIVTFSERADKTSGSTSDVKAGEKLPVGELLYGMMLPSGNDATVAFAEHFGDRLADEKDKEAKPSSLRQLHRRR